MTEAQTIEQEIDAITARVMQAEASAQEAQARLAELAGEKDALSARVFAGDAEAIRQYDELEAEETKVRRAMTISRAAAGDLAEDLETAKVRRKAAQADAAQERYSELHKQSAKLEERVDELLDEVKQALDEHAALHHRLHEAASGVDANTARSLAMSPPQWRWPSRVKAKLGSYAG